MVIEKFPVPNFSLFLESGFIGDLEFLEENMYYYIQFFLWLNYLRWFPSLFEGKTKK